ncbi:AAA domain-containing protein [Candidatus Dojkabacteria bacterium]|nr:AAA domain-containing protein [Candidatus Dojkabacteria bacterium]
MAIKTIDETEGLDRLTENAKLVVLKAYDLARYEKSLSPKKQSRVEPRHLLVALSSQKGGVAYRVLTRLGVKVDDMLLRLIRSRGMKARKIVPSDDFNEIVFTSFVEANKLGHVYVGSEHLLLALFRHESIPVYETFQVKGLSYEVVKKAVTTMGNYQPGIFSSMPERGDNEGGALEYFARDMNQMAAAGKFLPIFGRNDEIERLIHILSRKNKNNPVLIGEPGVGKTAIVEGFVQKIRSGDVPDSLTDAKVIMLDLAVILAGAKIRGDVEERLIAVIEELKEDPNKIVFIDEIHMIIGAGTGGGGGGMDIANLLKPHLTSGDIKVIGATTFDEYQKYFEEDNALSRRFQPIQVEEISVQDSEKLMNFVRSEYEKFHGIKIGDDALIEAVKLGHRYITDRYLPDKALDLIDETAAKKRLVQRGAFKKSELSKRLDQLDKKKRRAFEAGDFETAAELQNESKKISKQLREAQKRLKTTRKRLKIDAEDIREVVSKITGIPLNTLTKSDKQGLKNLQKDLASRIIGQQEAIASVSNALKRARVGLVDQDRPLASFLFLGPTGVGKTETGKVIAENLFGDENALVQINMSEYMEAHSVSKIIGSPPGYVGYSEGGQLTEKIRRKPYSVILFDEMEKAHPDTLNILLQILDEGEVKDSKGRMVNFRNTIIIMTSNIGAEEIADDEVLGFDIGESASSSGSEENSGEDGEDRAYVDMKKKLMVELKSEMRPEFLNRIDDIVIFRGLDQEDAKEITKLLLEELSRRLEEFDINLSVSKKAIDEIVERGFSSEYGARNLRRKIQEIVEVELSNMILEGKIDVEDQEEKKVGVNFRKDKFVFEIK